MKLTDEQRNHLIEVYEGEYEKQGQTAPEDKVYDWEFVLSAVKHYGYSMAYRAKKNKKDQVALKIGKALEGMDEEKKSEFLRNLGIHTA